VFQNLICGGHEVAKARGAAFIFGFPNEASYPLFVHKLGYRPIPSVKWQSFASAGIGALWFRQGSTTKGELAHDAIFQDEHQLIALKKEKYGDAIHVVEFKGSLAWGMRRLKRRAGVSIPYLDVGGISLEQPTDVRGVLAQLRAAVGFVAYTQLVTIADAPYLRVLRKVAPASTSCLILHDLNENTEGLSFNLFNGIRDVY
jgi:hypothetical protein